ncbi:hypothetical protein [Thauera sp. WH-1]|uniref:hypothetical protein n=1 Tax=Thauera sp. WH-1 TaxID=3398230 RepID=UPI0039FC0D76
MPSAANTRVFTGADGSILLAPAGEGPEGAAAGAVIEGNDLIQVGRVTGVTVQVSSAIRPFHEIGQRYASELRSGNVSVRGHIDRAWLNGALLRLLLGEASEQRPRSSWSQPAFNITLMAENAANPGTKSIVTLHEVKLEQWNLTMPEDDFVMEGADFQALYVTVRDERG